MIVVADSGSTKTDWLILSNTKDIEFKTKGINPFFLDKNDVKADILAQFPSNVKITQIDTVYFYGPACSTPERCNIVHTALETIFSKAQIFVDSDLTGAARALFQNKSGIACILGTGSNSGLYDGKNIIDNITSTGYILGDEGSGAHLGLELIKKIINHQLEESTEELFYKTYNLSPEQIIDKVYKEPYPNRFLASFAPFISKNIDAIPSLKKIASDSFTAFIDIHVLPYKNAQSEPIALVGSIAFYFKDLIQEIASQKKLRITKIISNPIYDLAKYHKINIYEA